MSALETLYLSRRSISHNKSFSLRKDTRIFSQTPSPTLFSLAPSHRALVRVMPELCSSQESIMTKSESSRPFCHRSMELP